MPSAQAFLAGFNLHKNLKFGNYILVSVKINHIQIIRYRQYKYPIQLTFRLDDSTEGSLPKDLLSDVKEYTKGSRVIYTSYGNPYECTFGSPTIAFISKDTVVIDTEGFSQRIFIR